MPENTPLRIAANQPLARIEPVAKTKVTKPGDLTIPPPPEGKPAPKPLILVPQPTPPPRAPRPSSPKPPDLPPPRPEPEKKPVAAPVRRPIGRPGPKPPAQPQRARAMMSEARRALLMRYLSKRYTLLGPLGAGGMGTVFKAKDKLLGMEVAIKAMPPELMRDPSAAESLKNEARLAMTLSHDNIVRLYHFDIEKGVMYLVMELVDGKDFRAILAETGALSAGTVLDIATSLASAIDYAHSRGVFHRDLKPENIMLNSQGVVKIVDFGTARHAKGGELRADRDFVEGTPVYSPPEQFAGDPPCPSMDIYALGAVIQELLCGLPIFPETVTIQEQMTGCPADLPAEFPVAVNETFRRCLARNPDERWPTATEFATQLRAVCVANGLVEGDRG